MKHEEVLTVPADASVEQTLQLLHKNHLLSVPVVDKSGAVLGLVDLMDIVSFVLSVSPDPLALKKEELQSLEIAGRTMALEHIKNVIDASGKDPYVPISNKNKASMAIPYFAKGIHRLPVINDNGKLVGILAQSDIVRLLGENLHMGKLKVIGERKVTDLGLGLEKPLTVKKSDTVLRALHGLKHGVSALAVLESDGKLGGTFSVSDLIGLYKDTFPHFLLTVEDFLNQNSPKSLNSVVVYPTADLLSVVKELVGSGIHRVWVIDNDYRPAGVISMTDICKVVRDLQ